MTIHRTTNKLRNIGRGAARAVLATLVLAIIATLVPAGSAGAATSPIRVTGAGDLTVTGTNARDEISFTQAGSDRFEVRFETGGGDSTVYIAEGVTRNVTFNMRGGDDIIYLDNAMTFPNNLTIRWGSGDSVMSPRSNPVTVNGNLTVIDGSGETSMYLTRFAVLGRTRVSLGGGPATVRVRQSLFFDDFAAATSSAGEFRMLEVESNVFYDRFSVNGGNKSDHIETKGSWFRGQTRLSLRGGDDNLQLSEQTLIENRTTIAMGNGDDIVGISYVTVDAPFNLKADGGDDLVRLFGNTFNGRSTFNGGGGADNLGVQTTGFNPEPRIIGFEQ